jgi:hypothetical protein
MNNSLKSKNGQVPFFIISICYITFGIKELTTDQDLFGAILWFIAAVCFFVVAIWMRKQKEQ